MENLYQELIEKAKQAKSVEELLALAKENGMEITEDEAKAYYAQLSPKSGELSDEELDNVAGGGCSVKVSGHKYTVVSSGVSCFNGCYECGMFWDNVIVAARAIIWSLKTAQAIAANLKEGSIKQ